MDTYLNDIVNYKKKITRLFTGKVVEVDHAERVQAAKLEERRGISRTELPRLNHSFPYYIPPNVMVRRAVDL